MNFLNVDSSWNIDFILSSKGRFSRQFHVCKSLTFTGIISIVYYSSILRVKDISIFGRRLFFGKFEIWTWKITSFLFFPKSRLVPFFRKTHKNLILFNRKFNPAEFWRVYFRTSLLKFERTTKLLKSLFSIEIWIPIVTLYRFRSQKWWCKILKSSEQDTKIGLLKFANLII